VAVVAPASGVVVRRAVTQGDRAEAGAAVLDLADLSRVWVLASVYEHDIPFVKSGQKATMALPYSPGVDFEGLVTFVYPTLDPATRTVQVRLEFPNPDLALKPEMFAEVRLEADLGERVAVPDSAVIETGTRSVVFVDEGEGLFEPRELRIGLRLADLYEVLDGVTPGERIVVSGNFLVDSESRLKAALAAMSAGEAP
jgi:RND family efflux transporter MFP subunit